MSENKASDNGESLKEKMNRLLHDSNYAVTKAMPESLQTMNGATCDVIGGVYPKGTCDGVRHAIADSQKERGR